MSIVRELLTFISATLFIVSGLIVGSNTALAVASCNSGPAANTADVTLTQTLTLTSVSGSTWTLTKNVQTVNNGPCHVPGGAIFSDILPAGATVQSIVTSPSSWICPPTPFTGPKLTCTSSASFGVPGTQEFTLVLTMSAPASPDTNVTDTAFITFGGPTDPNLADNCAVGGVVGANGGIITTGDPDSGAQNCPSAPNAFTQVEQIKMPGVGSPRSIQVQELKASCPGGVGRCVFLNSGTTSDYQLHTFTINQAALGAKSNKPGLLHCDTNCVDAQGNFIAASFTSVPTCKDQPTADPCITEITTFKIGKATFVKITYRTLVDDFGGFD